jgi:hypothetical protein
MFFVEGSDFFDPKTFEYEGKDLWLFASEKGSSSALQKLHKLGCKTSGTDLNGRNCLFLSIMNSEKPNTSDDFEKLQFLLGIFDNISAQDAQGCTIFDLVNGDTSRLFSPGSYQRDLLYCALERVGIDISDHLTQYPRIGLYKSSTYGQYTPEHYRALNHLQSWDDTNFRSQMDRLLQEIPLDEEESRGMESVREEKEMQRKYRREMSFEVSEYLRDLKIGGTVRDMKRKAEEESSEWETEESGEDDKDF